MCTVTFIPSIDTIYITSNRDERQLRSPALPPSLYDTSSGKAIFPKDGDGGGSWIACHENTNALVFLNGGTEAHVPAPPYRKSRGLILVDLLDHPTPFNGFLAIKLNNIEPFTAIIRDNQHLFECRWDGKHKSYQELDLTQSYIWSSATLYDAAAVEKRNAWFQNWISRHPNPKQDEIFKFHQYAGDGDPNNDLVMNRKGDVFTVSITLMAITDHSMKLEYLDIKTNERFRQELESANMAGK